MTNSRRQDQVRNLRLRPPYADPPYADPPTRFPCYPGHKKCSNRRRVRRFFASSARAPRVLANFS